MHTVHHKKISHYIQLCNRKNSENLTNNLIFIKNIWGFTELVVFFS
jgi:hypothetical protein